MRPALSWGRLLSLTALGKKDKSQEVSSHINGKLTGMIKCSRKEFTNTAGIPAGSFSTYHKRRPSSLLVANNVSA